MSSEIEQLKVALEAANRNALQAEQRAVQAEQRAEEERRRREQADEDLRSTTLQEFLQRCHDLCTAIEVVTDKSMTTGGDITHPDNRLYPKKILPWTDFTATQASIWADIGEQTSFAVDRHFASRSDFVYVRRRLAPVSSEISLRRSQTMTVENMVSDLFEKANEDEEVRQALRPNGSIEFQDHTNLGDAGNAELSQAMRQLSMQQTEKRATRQQSPYRHRGTADQFCVLRSGEDGSRRPVVAIEYKAPHKLSVHTISTGLAAPIDTQRDAIAQRGEPADEAEQDRWWCRYVMAAVITQLFSYMVAQNTRYGYVCTGQAYVFLCIGDNPSEVYHSVHIPSLDVDEADEDRLHETIVARIFAFTVMAAREAGPVQMWQRQAHLLSPWVFDLDHVFLQMPSSVRTSTEHSAYRPARSRTVITRSPIRTRNFCRIERQNITPHKKHDDSEDDCQDEPDSPSTQRQLRKRRGQDEVANVSAGRGESSRWGRRQRSDPVTILPPADRAYCSHECLLGLNQGTTIHLRCPNAKSHGPQHPQRKDFLSYIRRQLTHNIDKCCRPLYLHGAKGGLLRISVEPSGYTFVAKGTEEHNLPYLRQERRMYHHLSSIQGQHIPVCLGLIRLEQPYFYSGAHLSRLLLLSWGGYTLSADVNRSYRHLFLTLAEKALAAVHQLGILHNDAESRNMLFNPQDGRLTIIDFERASSKRSPLADVHSNARRAVSQCAGSSFATDLSMMRRCLKS